MSISETMEFNLSYRRTDFENIYYADSKGSYIKSEQVKKSVKFLMIAGIGFIICGCYSVFTENYTPLSYAVIALVIILFIYITEVMELYKWKNTVKTYLDGLDKVIKFSLTFGESYISITQDGFTYKYALKEFTKVDLTDEYVWLYGTDNILIPAASLDLGKFEELRNLVNDYFN